MIGLVLFLVALGSLGYFFYRSLRAPVEKSSGSGGASGPTTRAR